MHFVSLREGSSRIEPSACSKDTQPCAPIWPRCPGSSKSLATRHCFVGVLEDPTCPLSSNPPSPRWNPGFGLGCFCASVGTGLRDAMRIRNAKRLPKLKGREARALRRKIERSTLLVGSPCEASPARTPALRRLENLAHDARGLSHLSARQTSLAPKYNTSVTT